MLLRFVNNWFAPRCNPIGVDFGTDCLRLAQVQWMGTEHKLIAAATADVPSHVRNNLSARIEFFVETTRDLLAQSDFHGRQAVLGLPAAWMHVMHLRLPKMDDEALRKALPWETRGKLPIDPSQALIRHLIAGDVYQDQEPRDEVIVLAAAREAVNQLLAAAARAKLDIVGMNTEPSALLDCFGHVYRRKPDAETVNCFIDIGSSASRAIVTCDQQILFVRTIPVGGDHFSKAVSTSLGIGLDDARTLRIKLAHGQAAAEESADAPPAPIVAPAPAAAKTENPDDGFALLQAGLRASERKNQVETGVPVTSDRSPLYVPPSASASPQHEAAIAACMEPLNKLVHELDLCRRYHESTFPNKPISRLVFVGGEARHRALCQSIAQRMSIAAQVGDPLVRMGRISELGTECGIDRRQPQPSWAVAIGLSMGPAAAEAPAVKQGAALQTA